MALWLKQSTSVDIGIGPFVDNVDGFTAKTALSITQPNIRLKKNSGNWAQKAAAQTLSHEENGWYELTLDATDTNTLGILLVSVQKSGALPVWHEFHIVGANIYDSIIGFTDLLDINVSQWLGNAVGSDSAGTPNVNTKQWNGNNVTTPNVAGTPVVDVTRWLGTTVITPAVAGTPGVDVFRWLGDLVTTLSAGKVKVSVQEMAANVITSGVIATDAIGADELAADAVAEIQSGLATSSALATVQADTDDIQSRLPSALVGGRMDSSVGNMANNVITSGVIATDAINATKVADGTIDAATFASGAIDNTAFNVTEILTANPATSGITSSSFAAGAINASAIATDAIGASELAADAANEIADAILKRDMGAVSGEAARSLLNAIRKLMNKWSISGTVLTVTKEDDSTTAYTQNITATPNADPITGLDTV